MNPKRFFGLTLTLTAATVWTTGCPSNESNVEKTSHPGTTLQDYHKWDWQRSKDNLTGKEILVGLYFSNHNNSSPLNSKVIVRCQDNKFEVYFNFYEFLDRESAPVRYKVNNQPLVEETWNTSTEGQSVFAKDAPAVARKLAKGEKFVIEARDHSSNPHQMVIDLSGSEYAINPALKLCGEEPD